MTIGTLFHEARARDWRDDGTHRIPTPEKIAERRRDNAERTARENAARAQERARAATRAAALWRAATPAPSDHPYLTRKRVGARGVRVGGDGRLVVPMRDADGALRSLQFVDGDGDKRYLPGGRVDGCYHAIGKPNGRICICEGYATTCTYQLDAGEGVCPKLLFLWSG